MSFLDPVDRDSCIRRTSDCIENLFQSVVEQTSTNVGAMFGAREEDILRKRLTLLDHDSYAALADRQLIECRSYNKASSRKPATKDLKMAVELGSPQGKASYQRF